MDQTFNYFKLKSFRFEYKLSIIFRPKMEIHKGSKRLSSFYYISSLRRCPILPYNFSHSLPVFSLDNGYISKKHHLFFVLLFACFHNVYSLKSISSYIFYSLCSLLFLDCLNFTDKSAPFFDVGISLFPDN